MTIEIKTRWDGRILFSGEFASLKEALQEGVKNRANLNRANLNGASLDGASLAGASLAGANLAGASLDGANLAGASLDGASLDGANLAGASLDGANLDGASLAGASLAGASLAGASLADGITVNQAPIQIIGLTWPITIWDNHMRIGCQLHSHADWQGFPDEKWLEMGGREALRLKQEHLSTLMALCDSHAKKAEGK